MLTLGVFGSFTDGYLLPGDGHVVRDVGEHGGLYEVAGVPVSTPTTLQAGPLTSARLDQPQNLLKLLLVHLHTNIPGCLHC